jgi:hypothetical protein
VKMEVNLQSRDIEESGDQEDQHLQKKVEDLGFSPGR